ncbi:hypothetical protein COOONC_07769 [Cooperia oncophora]
MSHSSQAVVGDRGEMGSRAQLGNYDGNWQRSFPEWVELIEGDILSGQTNPRRARNLSDIYQSAHPEQARRQVVAENASEENVLSSALRETVDNVFHGNVPGAVEANMNSPSATNAFSELMDMAIQRRIEEDSDYDPSRYPNIDRRLMREQVRSASEILAHARKSARKQDEFSRGGFHFVAVWDHILESQCAHDEAGDAQCSRCRFESSLRLPELPEMVFPNNTLTIEFTKFAGSSINFNALDALKMVSPDVLPDVQDEFSRGGFHFVAVWDHILESQCAHDEAGDAQCSRCRFESSLRLPELPEMVFPNNTLTIEFTKFAGSSINFNALDALKMVSPDVLPDVQVSVFPALCRCCF